METTKNGVPKDWSIDSIGSLKGQVIIITGANAGIGFEASLELAKKGAHVILACRNAERAKAAAARIEAMIQDDENGGSVEVMLLDTSSVVSVRAFVAAFRVKHSRLNVLINNAAVFAIPFELTVDGTERQFATNHLGHFVLTLELLDVLKESAPSRIVNVSSSNHNFAKIVPKEEIASTKIKDYSPLGTYALTKLYILLFTKELARRLEAANITGVKVVSCHPGAAKTSALSNTAAANSGITSFFWKLVAWVPIFQKASVAVLSTLYAATADNVQNADYYGPRFLKMWGSPALESPSATTNSREFALEVWEKSEDLAGTKFVVSKN